MRKLFFYIYFFSSKDYKVTNTAQIIESQKTVLNFKQTTKNRPLGTKWSTLVENTKGIIISNLITILYLKIRAESRRTLDTWKLYCLYCE